MDALLSSFYFTRGSHGDEDGWYYYRMPPVDFRSMGASFRPDYSVFFLCDSFYVDVFTVERVKTAPEFAEHKALFDALRDAGRLKVIDYQATIRPYEEVIDSSAARDVSELGSWVGAFLELRNQWRDFITLLNERQSDPKPHDTTSSEVLALVTKYDYMVPGILDERLEVNLRHWKEAIPRQERDLTRLILWPYLAHVSATLCLADCLNAIVHDWADISPLYRHKLSRAVAVNALRDQKEQDVCREVLALMFPDCHPKSPAALARLLDDPRTETLRDLVRRCAENNVAIDVTFANSLLRDILAQEEKLNRYRNIAGWLTTPLSFVPWAGTALEKGTQLAVERCAADRVRGGNVWFFLLSAVNDAKKALRS